MSSEIIIAIIASYFVILSLTAYFTSKGANNATFFSANKSSSWLLVAFGMIGASLSGVTFISIPGVVGTDGYNQAFSYMQMVFGYLVGYLVIAQVLMPLYYKWNVTSIYSYLGERLGPVSHKTASAFFLLSRSVGASLRLYLVAIILQKFVMESYGIPFEITVILTIALIWIYTFRGGIKTIVWTDTIQTAAMLISVIGTIIVILQQMDFSIADMWDAFSQKGYNQVFFFDEGWNDPNNFFKQFISGALIATVMTGLDQDMMQKNLTCKSLPDAQKNIYTFSIILVFANLLFLSLGALLYVYAAHLGIEIPSSTDQLFPLLALGHLPAVIAILFIIGLIAAAYSSADSALTSLTTAFCIDFLNMEERDIEESTKRKRRILVHIGFSILLIFIILFVDSLEKEAIVNQLFKAASYTYGPLLGLFAFSILTKRKLIHIFGSSFADLQVILFALLAIFLTYILDTNSKDWFNGFTFGNVIMAVNGFLMFLGLFLTSKKA